MSHQIPPRLMQLKHSRTSVQRTWLVRKAAALLVITSCVTNLCQAQQSYLPQGAPAQEEKPSIFIKLDRFQKSVKQKMKNTFSKKSEPAPPARNTFAGRPQIPMNTVDAMRNQGQLSPQRTAFPQQPTQLGDFAAQSRAYQSNAGAYQTNSGAYPPSNAPGGSPTLAPPQMSHANGSQIVNWANYQQPPPAGTLSATEFSSQRPNADPIPQPTPPRNQNPNPYQNPAAMNPALTGSPAIGLPPSEYGVHLGTQHVTATEHALRLKAENEQLKLDRQSLVDRIERLLSELESTKRSLAKSGGQVESLNQRLEKSKGTNRDLEQQLTALRSEHEKSLLETDRMLTSIRAELDDLVMREVAANGN
ncbi:MAG: hypothetical protein ACE361_12775 [Aureliella sp.]